MITEDTVLKALDRPRKLFSILSVVAPGGREDSLQGILMTMRDKGKVHFDIKKGTWRRLK